MKLKKIFQKNSLSRNFILEMNRSFNLKIDFLQNKNIKVNVYDKNTCKSKGETSRTTLAIRKPDIQSVFLFEVAMPNIINPLHCLPAKKR